MRKDTKILERKNGGHREIIFCSYLNTLTQCAQESEGCCPPDAAISVQLPFLAVAWGLLWQLHITALLSALPSGPLRSFSLLTTFCSQLWFWLRVCYPFFRKEGSLEIFPTSCKHSNPKIKFPLRSRCSGANAGQSANYQLCHCAKNRFIWGTQIILWTL